MGTLKKHYESELAKEKPNQALLSTLSGILKEGTLTLHQWGQTGKFIPKSEFLAENPNVNLLKTCSEVIQYIGGHYIQVLKSGTFRYDSKTKGKVLDKVELGVWDKVVEDFWR